MNSLEEISKKIISSAIKNPPTYHNGNQCVLIPISIFRQFENIINNSNIDGVNDYDETTDDDDYCDINNNILL